MTEIHDCRRAPRSHVRDRRSRWKQRRSLVDCDEFSLYPDVARPGSATRPIFAPEVGITMACARRSAFRGA